MIAYCKAKILKHIDTNNRMFQYFDFAKFPLYLHFNPISHGVFFPWLPRGGADSAHHFGKPGRASFKILTSFEKTPLILHGRRPRIQKMKCLAQKLTKWRRIEKLWRKREIDRFRILKDLVRFALCKFPTHRRQSGSHFAQGGPILPKLVSMAS